MILRFVSLFQMHFVNENMNAEMNFKNTQNQIFNNEIIQQIVFLNAIINDHNHSYKKEGKILRAKDKTQSNEFKQFANC